MQYGVGIEEAFAHRKRTLHPNKHMLKQLEFGTARAAKTLPLAPRGDSQHATWVEDPGILGANIVQMGRRLAEAPAAWAPCLGKWPGLSGARTCPASKATKASAVYDPAFTCTPSNLHSALRPHWKERSQS